MFIKKNSHVLVPCLIRCTWGNPIGLKILMGEGMSPLYLWNYLRKMETGGFAASEVDNFARKFERKLWPKAAAEYLTVGTSSQGGG